MSQELVETLASEIITIYNEVEQLVKNTKEYACLAIQKAIKCGHLLIKAQEVVGRGNFEQWLRDNTQGLISRRTAFRYIKLAKIIPVSQCGTSLSNSDHPTLRQAYIAAGILPDPTALKYRDVGPSRTSPRYLTYIANAQGAFNVEFSKRPIETWDESEREQVKAQLEPLVKIYEML